MFFFPFSSPLLLPTGLHTCSSLCGIMGVVRLRKARRVKAATFEIPQSLAGSAMRNRKCDLELELKLKLKLDILHSFSLYSLSLSLSFFPPSTSAALRRAWASPPLSSEKNWPARAQKSLLAFVQRPLTEFLFHFFNKKKSIYLFLSSYIKKNSLPPKNGNSRHTPKTKKKKFEPDITIGYYLCTYQSAALAFSSKGKRGSKANVPTLQALPAVFVFVAGLVLILPHPLLLVPAHRPEHALGFWPKVGLALIILFLNSSTSCAVEFTGSACRLFT